MQQVQFQESTLVLRKRLLLQEPDMPEGIVVLMGGRIWTVGVRRGELILDGPNPGVGIPIIKNLVMGLRLIAKTNRR